MALIDSKLQYMNELKAEREQMNRNNSIDVDGIVYCIEFLGWNPLNYPIMQICILYIISNGAKFFSKT
jgi:hypothetical protein